MSLPALISKLRLVTEPTALMELEEQFNAIGLTVQTNQVGKMFLCQIDEGKPSCMAIFEDYIPICMTTDCLNDSIRNIIFEFVIANVREPKTIDRPHLGHGDFTLYGSNLHDGVNAREQEHNLIEAISEWLGE